MFCLIQSHCPRTSPSGLWLPGQQESCNSLVSVYHLPSLGLQVSTILAFHSVWGSKLRPSPLQESILQTESSHWPYYIEPTILFLNLDTQAYCTAGASLYTMYIGLLFSYCPDPFLRKHIF